MTVTQTTFQKHIGLYLDEKFNYNTHIKEKPSKFYSGIGLLRNLSNELPRQILVTIYKVFIISHLHYGDIVYNKPNNETFINKNEKAQYDSALAIAGAIRGRSWEKLYAQLSLQSFKFRRWFRKLAYFYKIQSTGLRKYLLQLISTNNQYCILRKPLNIPHYYCRADTFKNSFFPNVINEWNKLDQKIKDATSFSLFQASLLKMGRPHANSTYRIHNPIGIKLLTRLHLGLSHLTEHKFRHNIVDCVNPLCSCSVKPEIYKSDIWLLKVSLYSNFTAKSFWHSLFTILKSPIFILTSSFTLTSKWHLSVLPLKRLALNRLNKVFEAFSKEVITPSIPSAVIYGVLSSA